MRKWVLIGAILFLLFGTIVAFLILRTLDKPPAATTSQGVSKINSIAVSEDSYSKLSDNTAQFSLYSKDKEIYVSSQKGERAALEFIEAASQEGENQFLPVDKASKVAKTREEIEETGLEHYYYEQTINNVPVYGSAIQVHIKDGNTVYAADGKVVRTTKILPGNVFEDQAIQIAYAKATEEAGEVPLVIESSNKTIINPVILGTSDDSNNYLSLAVRIQSEESLIDFDTTYFVELTNGAIIHSVTNIAHAKNRQIRDGRRCQPNGDPSTCTVVRSEGGQASGIADVDKAYEYIGEAYDYFFTKLKRDSYDNRGSSLNVIVQFVPPENRSNVDCRNAYWISGYNTIVFCQQMVANDIAMHELAHGVTNATAQLEMHAQSGALNESFSDIFAHGLDDDWTLGEDGHPDLGIVRYFNDPPRKGQSDNLYSPLYLCPANSTILNPCYRENNYCGVHINSGILNKAYYLMVDGGTFGGCSVSKVQKEKVQKVMYRALTLHLQKTSNLRNAYDAINRACGEISEMSGEDCKRIKIAMQSTKMDQQELGDILGNKCRNKPEQEASCSGNRNEVTPSPAPSRPATTPTRTPTTLPGEQRATPGVVASPTRAVTGTQSITSPPARPTAKCTPKNKPDSKGCEQPTVGSPEINAAAGQVTFTWCTSSPQHSYQFRLDNTKSSKNPDTVVNNHSQQSITLPLSEGNYGWWVHSYCTNKTESNFEDDYLSKSSGRELKISKNVPAPSGQAEERSENAPTMTPRPSPTPTTAAGGSSQRRLD